MDISEADLTRLLPTCQRCRRLRRKCDTQLPACRLCQKGKAECTFFDHALQQALPRSYVHSLLTRLSRLRAVQATINNTPLNTDAATALAQGYGDNVRPTSTASNDSSKQLREWGPVAQVSFDKHFSLDDANPTCWQFFGSSSAYALAVEVLVVARSRFGPISRPENYTGSQFKLKYAVPEQLERKEARPCPPRSEVEMLVQLYIDSISVTVGHSDRDQLFSDIDTYLRHQNVSAKYLLGPEAHQFFRIAMMCAIAAANKARHQPRYATESFNYYIEALPCAEEVTSTVSLDALEALILFVAYSFFFPRRGDVWKLLDYACRLSVELNMHCETNDEYEDVKDAMRRRRIFWGLYSLERTFGQHLGRPSDLPEEIITAEYPDTEIFEDADFETTQKWLVSHYYRLIYIRSEIFRVLYLPAVAPDLPRTWYEERYATFVEWKAESDMYTNQPNHIYGMGTMQCEMGFNTSISYLFQPLILRALAAIKEPHTLANLSPDLVIPRESWGAAVANIAFYDRLFHQPEGSPEGNYPINIISAHYIHQATLTIMAHILLVIDGRIPLVSFARNHDDFTRTISTDGRMHVDVPPLDLSNVYQISNMCLNLLHQLSDRWEGMVGILDLFREMSNKVLPALNATR